MFFRFVPIDDTHNRQTFCCGSEPLDKYFKERVTQDIRRRMTTCFVAIASDGTIAGYYTGTIAGYYTLASASVLFSDLPKHLIKILPRYPSVPAVRMGRLAVDQKFQGQGLGGMILADALMRIIRSEIAAYALVVTHPMYQISKKTGVRSSKKNNF